MNTIELKFKLDIIFEYIVPLILIIIFFGTLAVISIKQKIKEKKKNKTNKEVKDE